MKRKLVISSLLALLVLSSCKKNTVPFPEIPDGKTFITDTSAVFKELLLLGYQENEIQILPDHFLVDGDLLVSKTYKTPADLKKYLSKKGAKEDIVSD
ncbi:MAG: hypothetical protein ACO1NW_13685 [Chitinophagaceae bacterium]